MESLLEPERYIGRCPEQVERLITKVKPLLEGVDDHAADIEC